MEVPASSILFPIIHSPQIKKVIKMSSTDKSVIFKYMDTEIVTMITINFLKNNGLKMLI